MKNLDKLIDKQSYLYDCVERHKVQLKKVEQELDGVSNQIEELKEQQDYSSFKFVYDNMPLIIKKIAPKHKTANSRNLDIVNDKDSIQLSASIPWAYEKCSDENPCNVGTCPKCTLQHFNKVLGKLLAEYYAK